MRLRTVAKLGMVLQWYCFVRLWAFTALLS